MLDDKKYKQKFRELTEDPKFGDNLFKFYTSYLNFGGRSFQPGKKMSVNELRLAHAKKIIEKYELEYIEKIAGVLMLQLDKNVNINDVIRTVRPEYFDKMLVNFKVSR